MKGEAPWSLSPAYDLSWAYNPVGAWTSKHQMSVNNKWDDIGRDDLLAVAKNVNIRRAEQIIEQVKEAVSQWPRIAKEQGIPRNLIEKIGKTLPTLNSQL
jgi:serine/threonine-protein kinase HipA